VVVPLVKTAEDAEKAVAACRYPPAGVRGFGPQRANGYGSLPLDEYLRRAESEPWVILQVEHHEAVRNLEDICAVPGVGSLLVGPFDLSASIGRPGDIAHPEVVTLLDQIGRIAREKNTVLGAFALSSDAASIERWIARGAAWLAIDTDQGLLRRAATDAIRTARAMAAGR
jgi:2-keto-3-deoxy-L-rhamnonate aldolase RhmA